MLFVIIYVSKKISKNLRKVHRMEEDKIIIPDLNEKDYTIREQVIDKDGKIIVVEKKIKLLDIENSSS